MVAVSGQPSPSSPATSRITPGGPATLKNPAIAARVRQLAAQAEHRRAIAEFRARRAADQQARLDALLLEAIARARQPPRRTRTPPQPGSPASRRHRHLPEHEHRMLPNHVQTPRPLTAALRACLSRAARKAGTAGSEGTPARQRAGVTRRDLLLRHPEESRHPERLRQPRAAIPDPAGLRGPLQPDRQAIQLEIHRHRPARPHGPHQPPRTARQPSGQTATGSRMTTPDELPGPPT